MNVFKSSTPEGINILRIQGRFVDSNMADILKAFDELAESEAAKLVINCKNVNIIDSAAVGFLVNKANEFRKKGSHFMLCGIGRSVSAMFKLAKLEELFEIHETEEEAVESIRRLVKAD